VSSSAAQPLLALLAHPVGGNPTQYMIEKAFAHHDLDWRYLTFEVGSDNLADAVRGLRALGFRGGHCADPHKQAVIPLLDRTPDAAAMIGAVNLILREGDALVGENTEGKGVVDAIRRTLDPAGRRVVLIGAGRVARAVAIELAAAGAAGLTIVNRTQSRAAELAEALTVKFQVPALAAPWEAECAITPDINILIQAASPGNGGEEIRPPILLDSLGPDLLVADVAADSPRSWLLSEAAERGCKTIDGLSMFIEQVAIAFRLWTGVDPDRLVLREAVEEFLEL
jgi:shikimate dehydrogenase